MFNFQNASSRLVCRSAVQHRAHAARVAARQAAVEQAAARAALALMVVTAPQAPSVSPSVRARELRARLSRARARRALRAYVARFARPLAARAVDARTLHARLDASRATVVTTARLDARGYGWRDARGRFTAPIATYTRDYGCMEVSYYAPTGAWVSSYTYSRRGEVIHRVGA